jgi:oligoendopeptidase F
MDNDFEELSRIDGVERELAEMRAGIQESLGVLSGLGELHKQVEDVVTTYNRAKALLGQAQEQLGQLEQEAKRAHDELSAHLSRYESRFAALEEGNLQKWRGYEQQLRQMQERLAAETGGLRTELGRQTRQLKEGFEQVHQQYDSRFDSLKGNLLNDVRQLQTRTDMRLSEHEERTNSVLERLFRTLSYVEESQRRTKYRVRLARTIAIAALLLAAVLAAYTAYVTLFAS